MLVLSFTNEDIIEAVKSKFGVTLTEDEVFEIIQARGDQIEDRISELGWEVIEDTIQEELPKFVSTK